MPYFWVILAVVLVLWWIGYLDKRIDALELAAPLQHVYHYDLRFTTHFVHDYLKLTPEEYKHLKPAIENHINLKIEFWRGHLVLFLTAEGRAKEPWPVYLRSSHYDQYPLTIWEKRFAEGEDNAFDFHPAVPRLTLSLTKEALELAAIHGRFGKCRFFRAEARERLYESAIVTGGTGRAQRR